MMCPDSTPNFLGYFDLTIAPHLLYYSYIPIIILSVMFAFMILRSKSESLLNKLFFTIAVSFSFWIINVMVQWLAVDVSIVHFAWELTALFELPIYLLSVYFVQVFITKQDISIYRKLSLIGLYLPVLIFLPGHLNISMFDLNNCEGIIGYLWDYIYIVEISVLFWVAYIAYKRKNFTQDLNLKKQINLLSLGVILFLGIFFISNLTGEITKVYTFNLIGPIGMVMFLALLSYMIVKFQTFNTKLLATQALVWGMAILIGAQFFFIQVTTNFILNSVTFVAVLFFGQLLIQAVKSEVKQREELQRINTELKSLIQQRESLVHLITHKVKGSFTRSKFLFAEMLQGSFGALSPELTNMTKRVFESDVEGIATVDLVLNASNMQKGTVKFDMKLFDFKQLFEDVANEKKLQAQNRGLEFNLNIKEGEYKINGDVLWLKEVLTNIFQNSILYTPKGKIDVSLERSADKILVVVKDTGVGIDEEDKKNLFTEGGRGKDSIKINVDSTGYGLYTVKIIIDAHHGKIWAESEGRDKGSTFYVELPLVS